MKNQPLLLPAVIVTLTGVTLLLSARQDNNKAADSLSVGVAASDPSDPPPHPVESSAPNPPAAAVKSVKLSYGLDEIAKMIEGGVDPEVVQAFIDSSTIAYAPTAEDIVHLRELGTPSPVVAALIRHGGKLREQGIQESRAIQAQLAQPSTPAVNYVVPPYAPVAAPGPQAASVTYNTFNYSCPPVEYAAYPGWSCAAPRYDWYPRYGNSYPRYYFSRHYFPTYYNYRPCTPFVGYRSLTPAFPRFGVGVGFRPYQSCRAGPAFYAGVRF